MVLGNGDWLFLFVGSSSSGRTPLGSQIVLDIIGDCLVKKKHSLDPHHWFWDIAHPLCGRHNGSQLGPTLGTVPLLPVLM